MSREPVIDHDNPEWTAADFARGVKFPGVSLAEAVRRTRGLGVKPAKQQVTLRIDRDVLGRFKDGGPGWQSRINEVLRKAVG